MRAASFTLPLGPGSYEITISAPGFVAYVQRLAATKAGSESREFVLQVEGPRETVDVSAGGGYQIPSISSATRTPTALRDVPQAVTIVTNELIADQLMSSIGDVVRYVPGISAHQGENNRDQVIIRGNSSSADFFVNGVRDDVQYYRDLYNLDRVEALKGPNALVFGRGGGGGVINRVTKEAIFQPLRQFTFQGGSFDNRRFTLDLDQPVTDTVALRLNGMSENSASFRDSVDLERGGVNPTLTFSPGKDTKMTVGYKYLKDTRVADRGITSFQGRPADVDPSTFYGNPDDSHVHAEVNLGTVSLEHRTGSVTIQSRTMIGGYDRSYQNFVPGAVTADASQVSLSAYNNATNRTNFFQQADLAYARSTGSLTHTFLVGAEAGRQLTDNFRNTGYFNNAVTSILAPFDSPTISTPVTFRQSATDADNRLITNVAAVFVQDQVDRLAPGPGDRRRAVRSLRSRVRQQPQWRHARPRRSSRIAESGCHLQAGRAAVALRELQRVVSPELGGSVLLLDDDHATGRARAVRQLRSRGQVGSAPPGTDDGSLQAGSDQHAVHRSQRPDTDRPDRESADEWVRARPERTGAAWVEHRRRLRVPGCVRYERDGLGARRSAGGPGAAPHLLALEQLPLPSAHLGRR